VKHPFQVGEFYKNRRGVYEVVRLDENQGVMIIRYLDTGEESESKIDVQAHIVRNMQWDQEMAQQEKEAAEARYQQRYGEDFIGLLPSDLKTNVEGTSWRSRRSLAGRVAGLLSAGSANPSYTFLSWAIYRWPVAFLSHHEYYQMASSAEGARKAKFTIELDENKVYYGFYIERGDGALDYTWDWLRLWRAFHQRPKLQDLIATLEQEHNVRFVGRAISSADPFHFANPPAKGFRSLWDEQNPGQYTFPERLRRLEEVPEGEWAEFYLMATMPKLEATQSGVQLAYTMAETMKAMLPIYTAAVRE
jgi:hypothetical protein